MNGLHDRSFFLFVGDSAGEGSHIKFEKGNHDGKSSIEAVGLFDRTVSRIG